MKRFRTFHWVYVLVTVVLAATLFALFNTGAAVRASVVERPDSRPLADSGDVIEVFNNAWSYSTIGLVYDPDRGITRYAHESQSSKHRPTIYDVETTAHTVAFSVALSTKNSGWPWQIDNRDGAGYDYVAGTYFLPDYNGDLSYADDNIVEVRPDGTILNAWEMDDEVGSNDSSDGTEIDKIIDIAVAPGNPTRYFVAAAYDGNRVYEINLTKTGTWWTRNSWSPVATYTLPIWDADNDNLGIDYDAENGYLYHSSWDTTTILITDLDMNPVTDIVPTFDCPGAGGYNSGVTYVEGSNPPEVWVTDFSSDKTTRCEIPGPPLPIAGWEKVIDGTTWTAGLSITTETSDTFQVTDVITAGQPFTLTESWDETRLQFIGVSIDPPLADIITTTNTMTVTGNEATPDVVTVTKQFLVQPCTWTQTIVSETLDIEEDLLEQRPFTVTKRAPVLSIGSSPASQNVYGGSATQFTLNYTNTGGFENAVVITSTFPVTAPFLYADPAPDATADDRSWARWDVGELANGDSGQISIYVYIAESAGVGEAVAVINRIYNHVGAFAFEDGAVFYVYGEAAEGWTKTIDGGSGPVEWSPTFSLTLETYDIFTVTDVITVSEAFILAEVWLTSELTLKSWAVSPATYAVGVSEQPGALSLSVPVSSTFYPRPVILTKVFTVNTCSWPQTVLGEQLTIGTPPLVSNILVRPVLIHKDAPILTLTATQAVTEAHGGEVVTYTLTYTNSGAYENQFTARADFPEDVMFVSSDPVSTTGDAGYAEWVFTEGLAQDDTGCITVTVKIADESAPATRLVITNTLRDHVDFPKALALVAYEIEPPEWEKRVKDGAWDAPLRVEAGDEFTVTEVITTGASFRLVDRWPETHLTLITYTHSVGASDIVTAAGRLTWTMNVAAPETVTLTKHFRTEVFTTAYTVLWEDLYVGGTEWERRPVLLERKVPELRLTKTASPGVAKPGEAITYALTFSNAGDGTASGVVLTDIIPMSITKPISQVMFTDHGSRITATAGVSYVWQISDLAPNAGGVITITGTLSESLPASLLSNEAEIAAANQAQVGGASPGEDSRITTAAHIAVDGDPLVCTLAITDPLTYAFCNGICGSVTFTNTGGMTSLVITLTQRFPSVNGEGLPRQYQLDAHGGSDFDARLTLCYADGELEIASIAPSEETSLQGFRYTGSGWSAPGTQSVNTGDNTITIEDITGFSAWGIGIPGTEQPTVVRQHADLSGLRNLTGLGLILLALGATVLAHRARKRQQ